MSREERLRKGRERDTKKRRALGVKPKFVNERLSEELIENICVDIRNLFRIKEICKKYNITKSFYAKACVPKVREKISTKELREIHSRKIKDYLLKNPEKHSWRGATRNKSQPCEKFKQILRDRVIVFEEEYQPLIDKGEIFAIDAAIISRKIAFEINGRQHYESKGEDLTQDRKLKPYYQRRHDLIESHGWKVYEVFYKFVYHKDFQKYLDNILND